MDKTNANGPFEFVITYHGPVGTYKTAYLTAEKAVKGLGDEIDNIPGTVVARVEQRPRKTGYFNRESFPELYE